MDTEKLPMMATIKPKNGTKIVIEVEMQTIAIRTPRARTLTRFDIATFAQRGGAPPPPSDTHPPVGGERASRVFGCNSATVGSLPPAAATSSVYSSSLLEGAAPSTSTG
jgi:hypothetical protein